MTTSRNFAAGIGFIVAFLLTVALTYGLYAGSFRSTVRVTVESDRAGLTMSKGAVVKLRGVEVGRVASVTAAPSGAKIDIEIDKADVDWVSQNSTAQIIPPTAFGAKYVQLTSGSEKGDDSIVAGSTIAASDVTVEVNEAFTNLAGVLEAAEPDKVNNTITALSQTLDQRGDKIGNLISTLQTYLSGLNQTIPELDQDLVEATDTASTYEAVAPDLVDLAGNLTTTTTTLTDRQADVDKFSRRLSVFSNNGETFVKANDDQVSTLLATLDPVTRILQRYSSVLPCTLEGTVINGKLAEEAVGGRRPGISSYTRVRPADEPYKLPTNSITLGSDRGPDCFGLPNINQADVDRPNPDFGTGSNPHINDSNKTPTDELSTTFFGLLSGLVNFS